MKAEPIAQEKHIEEDGSIIQIVIWRVPEPVPPTTHNFKYRMVYICDGIRVVGFDNERGKGDHMHLDGVEFPYEFTSLNQLLLDFTAEIAKRRMS